MNRRTRMLFVVVIAIVLASVASLSVYRAVQRIPVREVEIATAHAVVAVRPLPMSAARATTDRPPSLRTRRAAMARLRVCSNGM